jgi:replication-associated recombination protein RarA
VEAVVARGWGGRAWWITGPSGAGKTTLARIIASMGAEAIGVEELDSQRLTPARIREIVQSYGFRCLFGGGRAYIVNEAHGLRKDAIRELLTAIEPDGGLPGHIVWIFTTTKSGEAKLFDDDVSGDAAPLLSRCVEITLTFDDQTRRAFAERAQAIAQREGIDGLPLSVYSEAVSASGGNFRRVLQRIESGAFKDDAVAQLERELAMLKSTKGESAAQRREALTLAIAKIRARD